MVEIRDDYTLNNSSPIFNKQSQAVNTGILSVNNANESSDQAEISDDIVVSEKVEQTVNNSENFYTEEQTKINDLSIKKQNVQEIKYETKHLQNLIRSVQAGFSTIDESRDKIVESLESITQLSDKSDLPVKMDGNNVESVDDLSYMLSQSKDFYKGLQDESKSVSKEEEDLIDEVSSCVELKVPPDDSQVKEIEVTKKNLNTQASEAPEEIIKMHIFNFDANMILAMLSI